MAQVSKAVVYQRQWFQNPRILLGILAVVFVIWLGVNFQIWRILHIILIIQAIFFLMAFRRPVWAVASILLGQFTASTYMLTIGGTAISVRFLWAFLAIIILIPLLQRSGGIKLGSLARSLIIPAIIFYCLATIANAVNSDWVNTYQYLRTGVSALAIAIFLPAVVKDEKDIRLLTMVILFVCLASSVAAIMQHYQNLGLPVYTLTGVVRRGRAVGLAEGPIYLAYELPLVVLPLFGILLLKGVSRVSRRFLVIITVIITAALYFSYTRSGIYSLVPGVIVIFLLLRGKMKKVLFVILLITTVGFLLFTNTAVNRYFQGFSDEPSAAGRLVLWKVGMMIALDNPIFGIGQGNFIEVSRSYAPEVDVGGIQGQLGMGALGIEEAHNDFVRVWLSFGTPALLVYLWIFISIFRNFRSGYRRSSKPFIKALALGGCGALMAYVINAFTHNVMDSVQLLWILAGFSLAVAKLAEAPKLAKISEVTAGDKPTGSNSSGSSAPPS